VIPQLVVEVFDVAQVREQLTHNADNSTNAFVAFFALFQGERIFYHALNVSSVFGNNEVRSVAVIRLKIQLIVDCLLHVKRGETLID
jgi:hypothetical protein